MKSSGERSIRLGFIPLNDAAPLIVAHELGYFAEHELQITLSRQNSWAALRDNLLAGELDAAHCLFSMPLSVAARVGGAGNRSLRIAMVLSNNGQSITLARRFRKLGYANVWRARSSGLSEARATFAATFPGGTHDIWLRYWLRASGLDERRMIATVSPAQMVETLRHGELAGFCVGEPWNAVAVDEEVGFTHLNTQDLWQHHPEKALVVHERLLWDRRAVLVDVIGALLRACAWLENPGNLAKAATMLARPEYLNCPERLIGPRLAGKYQLGIGLETRTYGEDRVRFFRGGWVNSPRRAHALWFLAQFRRFGLLREDVPYEQWVDELVLTDVYAEAADRQGVEIASDDMGAFEITLDGGLFNPRDLATEIARP